MPKPFTRAQALQNAAFLARLAMSGNARLAAREVGMKHSTLFERRSKHAAFAQRWEAAVAAAHARFHLGGGKRGPEGASSPRPRRATSRGARRESVPTPLDFARDERQSLATHRTAGGEPVVVRTKTGRLQLRPAHPGKLTKAAEQAFLSALAATANVRLSAAAAGASARAFYRRRETDKGFAREMRLALAMGYERLECALISAFAPEGYEDDGWRNREPEPIPPMMAHQALQLLYLHQKAVRFGWDQPHRRKRRGEPWETYTERLRAMWTHEKEREAEGDALRRAARFEGAGEWRMPGEEGGAALPPLELVTGWSRADPDKAPHNLELALFGGWRIGEMERARRKRG